MDGCLQLDQRLGLLRQVVTPPKPFNSQGISNLLWALAKLVENGRLQLDQGSPGQTGGDGAVAAGGDSLRDRLTLKTSPTCCGRWRNWWRTDGSSWIRAT